MSEQNRPLPTDESASSGQATASQIDAVQARLHEAANAASGDGEDDSSGKTATEALGQAVAAAGLLATQGDGAEGIIPWIDPAPGTRSPATADDDPENKSLHSDGGCIRVVGDGEPVETQADVPQGADETAVALDALVRTLA